MQERKLSRTVGWALAVAGMLLATTLTAAPKPKKTTTTAPATAAAPTGTQPMAIFKCDCVVQGTPVEFPDDIYITNTGTTTLEKGTKVHWAIPNTNRMGDYTLTADLEKGKGVMLPGVLPGGVAAGTKCEVTKKESMKVQAMPKPVPMKMYSFGCVVQGTPVEFPDDIYISNKGTAAVAKGTTVHWAIPNTNRMGDYTLTEDLAAGKGVMVAGVLPGGVAAGTACTANAK